MAAPNLEVYNREAVYSLSINYKSACCLVGRAALPKKILIGVYPQANNLPKHQLKNCCASSNDGLTIIGHNAISMNFLPGLKRARRFPKPEQVFGYLRLKR